MKKMFFFFAVFVGFAMNMYGEVDTYGADYSYFDANDAEGQEVDDADDSVEDNGGDEVGCALTLL